MRISLLNLPVDNNYGGMLQRYALMTVLQRMGHEVIHLNCRCPMDPGSLIWRVWRDLKRFVNRILGRYKGPIMPEYRALRDYNSRCLRTDAFYKKKIKHTRPIDTKSSFWRHSGDPDAVIVGSDQVWRKSMTGYYGLGTYFLDYLPDSSVIRIAYGVSLGSVEDELSEQEKVELGALYRKFDAVSSRETSGVELIKSYGWTSPEPYFVLDPTLLLQKDDYLNLIKNEERIMEKGSILCYVLDLTEEKEAIINTKAVELSLVPYYVTIDGALSVEQWLKVFSEAEYVITDSYHGLLFSLIMEKQFYLFRNSRRGNARFDSIIGLCGINENAGTIDWEEVKERLGIQRNASLSFLQQALSR